MLTGLDRLETNKWHLHASKCTDGIPGGVCHVKATGEPPHEDKDKGMEGDHVGDEGVTTYFRVRSIFISS